MRDTSLLNRTLLKERSILGGLLMGFAMLIGTTHATAQGTTQATAQTCDPKKKPTSFDEFKACTYREPETGIWIVDGDVPITTEEELDRFYRALVSTPDPTPTLASTPDPAAIDKATTSKALGRSAVVRRPTTELIVNRVNNADDVWAAANRCAIRYCVSRATTGSRYQQVVDAMTGAVQAWSTNAGVRFVHAANEDNACTDKTNVDFDVQVTSGRPFLARAFFPAQARATRNVFIDDSSFSVAPPLTLLGVLTHELGHALGFRHEHTRPEAAQCFEDNNWRPLTPYDSNSVMHYPHCGGTSGGALALSPIDVSGSIALYGSSTNCATPPQGGTEVSCSVFGDGYTSMAGPTDAIYFRSDGTVCAPDGTATGTCRKWFGRCRAPSTGDNASFSVFDDGYANQTAAIDAVYFRKAQSACIPDGTATGTCRRWVGRPVTATGKPVQCFLFNDGYADLIGPTDAIYARAPNQVCMPDGSSTGACRRWFGRCRS
jgi:hypothetical protein